MDKRSVYLFDFDNTLFDTEKLRATLAQRAAAATGGRCTADQFLGADRELKTNGYLDLEKITAYFGSHFQLEASQARKIFLDAPFSECLFAEAVPLLRALGKNANIYSLGDAGGYQWTKIRGSGILEEISEDRIMVRQDKNKSLAEILGQLQVEGASKVTMVDDKTEVLDGALEVADAIGLRLEPIQLAYGKHRDRPSHYPERVSVVANLVELQQRLVSPLVEGRLGLGVEAQV